MQHSRRTRATIFVCAVVVLVGVSSSGSVWSAQDINQLGERRAGSTPVDRASRTTPGGDNPTVFSVDDGSYEVTIGIVNQSQTIGTEGVYLNRFTVPDSLAPFTLDSVTFSFPVSTSDGATGLTSGQQFELLVYDDPSGSGLPANTTLRVDQPFLIEPSNTVPQEVRLSLPVVIQSGDFWVGFAPTVTSIDNLPIFPGALDTNGTQQGRSWVFFNNQSGEHFNGPLATADNAVIIQGNWLFRASGQAGGFTCVTWLPPAARGGTRPPPLNAHICDDVPDPVAELMSFGPRDELQGYNVYRSSNPGVQTTPENRFASVPPSQTAVGSSVASGGSFFVVTAQYDTGESGPSNEIAVTPATITSVKVKSTKLNIKGTNFSDTVTVFLDGIPFQLAAAVKKAGTKVVQKGNLLTGETIGGYLASHGGRAKLNVRNTSGTFATLDITGP